MSVHYGKHITFLTFCYAVAFLVAPTNDKRSDIAVTCKVKPEREYFLQNMNRIVFRLSQSNAHNNLSSRRILLST